MTVEERQEIQSCVEQLKKLIKMKSHIYSVQNVQLRLQVLLNEETEPKRD